MKQRIIPIVSILIGILAFLLTYQYLRGKHRELDQLRAELYKGALEVEVVVAARDIPKGTVLAKEDLAKAKAFERTLKGNAVRIEDAPLLLGRKTMFKIDRGDAVFWTDIEGGESSAVGLAAVVTHGMRAISLSVGGAHAVSGMVQPNDRVDVLGTFSFPMTNAPGELESVTLTVLQDVTVLAVGQTMADRRADRRSASSGTYGTVTVEVTAREAELLIFAQQARGRLSLSLRNPKDVSFEKDLPVIDFSHLQNRLPELNLYRQRAIRHKRDM